MCWFRKHTCTQYSSRQRIKQSNLSTRPPLGKPLWKAGHAAKDPGTACGSSERRTRKRRLSSLVSRIMLVMSLQYPVPRVEWKGRWCPAALHGTGSHPGSRAGTAEPSFKEVCLLRYIVQCTEYTPPEIARWTQSCELRCRYVVGAA